MNDEIKPQKMLQGEKEVETKTLSTLSVEGEIPCIVVHSDEKHVQGINHILNPLKKLLPTKGFKVVFLSDEIKPLDHYGKTFEQLAEECALGIVILDGLRPNVLLEFGILIGKKKPLIPLQDEKATVAVKSFCQQGCKEVNLTEKQFKELKEPTLGNFAHISDLQGLHVEIVNKDVSLDNPKYPSNVIEKSIEKLMSRIVDEYKQSLKRTGMIGPDYLQEFHEVVIKISEYYGGIREFGVDDIKNTVQEIGTLEKASDTNIPSQIYSTIASLYVSLAQKTDWKDVNKITDYYSESIAIYKRILEFETDPNLKSQTQKKIGDAYWELSQYYVDKQGKLTEAIDAYEEALKVYALERFPMDYALTQNNLGTAYSTLAGVEAKAENCRKAINAFEEALKVRTLERFPMDYAMTQNNLGIAYSTLAGVEAKAENCRKAINAFEEALKVR
ncbi:MAG TPA: hypothetical protein VMX96_01045, partial [Dehalococcoidia bacterium]|nr:hypothetical protein [Dehalococcoidia bacterium]